MILKNYICVVFLSVCILFTIYKGRNQPVIEYISRINERNKHTALAQAEQGS